MTDDDDDFVPTPPRPLQRAVPIGPAGGKTPGVQQEPRSSQQIVNDAVRELGELQGYSMPRVDRSQRAREGWEKRRARQHLLPDRHAVGEMTVTEAIELARLIAKYPVLKKVLGA